ncbi:MAG: nucleotide exchange factor GrpE [Sporolactobacillus sp.]
MTKQANEEMKQKKVSETNETVNAVSPQKKDSAADLKETVVNEGKKEAAAEEAVNPEVEALNKKLNDQAGTIDKLKQEKEDLNNRLLRAQADFDNFRKRTMKEKADARKFRAQDIVTDMLDTLDNFQRALAVETASEDGKSLKQGMEMVLKKLEEALKKEGVEEIESLGKPFDPTIHQAVMQEASSEHEAGTVIQVLQAGYTLNGRVIRPAMVKVSA